MMAAISAVQSGAKVVVFEKKHRPGLKLGITGKGRCNLTNTAPFDDFLSHYGKNGKFLRTPFNKYFRNQLVDFCHSIGVATATERGGRVFPLSATAPQIARKIVEYAEKSGVAFYTDTQVTKIATKNKAVVSLKIKSEKNRLAESEFYVKAAIIATGGLSYPSTGSTGDGYRFARSAGHKVIAIRPSLIPLVSNKKLCSRLMGLSLKNVKVTVRINSRVKNKLFGEMLFTHFGLSGPVILSLSRDIVDALRDKSKVGISIDLKPALDDDKLDARLLRDLKTNAKKKMKSILKELLPSKMIDVCLELTGIPADLQGHQMKAAQRKKLRIWLKNFELPISGYRPIEEAIVTAGGVNIREIDPRTMESRLVKGLYFAGEVLDIDGDTGGFNLQAAFSTGYLAGQKAAEK